MKRWVAAIYLFFSSVIIFSQVKQYLFTNIDIKQGLSFNRVLCFFRDNKGFLWIGTGEGLCRFDGYTFKVFKNNPKDTASLKDNMITDIFQDHEGKLWIWNGDYLDIFDPETETFHHQQNLFKNRIQVPIQSKWFAFYDLSGNIIYANSKTGLYKYIVSADSVFQINFPYFTAQNTISCATIDNGGNIWVASTKAMLYKLHKENYNILDSFPLVNTHDNLYRIFIDKQNEIWIFDKNNANGLFYLNSDTRKMIHFNINSKIGKLNNNSVVGLIQNIDGKMWIAIDHGGINILDKSDFSVQYVLNNPFNERSICDNTLTTIFRDNQNFIWVGSFKRGFSYYHQKLFNFNLYKINFENSKAAAFNDIDNFKEDKKGNLWIGTNGGGLIYFDRQKNTFKQYANDPANPNSLSADVIVGMYIDKYDRLWCGTYFGGISVFDGEKFITIKNNPKDSSSLSDDRVWDICPASDGKLWVATLLGGVNVINPTTMKVEKIYRWNNDSSIRSYVVYTIFEDKNKLLWFATVDGIRSFDRKTNKFEYYSHDENDPTSLSKNLVSDIYEDSHGLFWVATADGLNLFDRGTKKFKVFKKEDGLPSNYIITITEDNNHNLWFSTSNGLSNLIVTKNSQSVYKFEFKNYDVFDGLQGNEFNAKAAYKTRKGELLFGGANGFNLFHPDNISIQNIPGEIVFTDLQVYNKSITNKDLVNGRKILSKSITYTQELDLTYKENVFTIGFSNLNFLHPERHKFKYLLENFNTEWFYTDGLNRKATYTNLDPGTYTFRVKATNTDGTWGDSEARLVIKITPPWWKTNVFRVLSILIIVFGSLFIYYKRIRSLQNNKIELESKVKERTNQLSEANTQLEEKQEEISIQNEELAKHRNQLEELVNERTAELEKAKIKAEESDKLKSAFLANMSHEIRTPMNAIVGFSSMLSEEDITETERKEFTDIINKNCDTLLVLINDILDLSKIEANQVKIFKSVFNIDRLLIELEEYYRLNKKHTLEIIYENREQKPNLVIYNDPVRVRQVLNNLLDNANKYTDQGFIKFGYKIIDHEIEFYVADSGIGIKVHDIDKLFNYFTKIETNSSKLYRGTGLGLAICKRIIELMGGSINVETEHGRGSTFTFSLPYEPILAPDYIETPKKNRKKIPSFENLTILVAEDESANFKFIQKALRSYKVNIVWKQNGLETVEYVKQLENYENMLILMDIKMPVMNGIEALNEIRKLDRKIPVIAITAYALESERFEILNNSFNDYLTKPIKQEMLIESIEKVIHNFRN